LRRWIGRARRSAFDSMVALVARMLWFVRNDVVFRNASPSVETTLQHAFSATIQWCSTKLVDRSVLFRE
jgi:hypothetical protein